MKQLVVILVLIATGAMSCQRSGDDVESETYWERLSPAMDSLSVKADECFDNGAPVDTVAKLIERIEDEAAKLKGRKAEEAGARIRFFKAMSDNRTGRRTEAVAELDIALAVCDSAAYPYTFTRAKLLKALIAEPTSTETFRMLLGALDFYKERGDLNQQATAALCLSQSLNNPTEPGLTLHYFLMADSIYELLGKNVYHTKNRINEAYLLYNLGDTAKSRRIFEDLRRNPIINDDEIALEMVLRNMAVFFGDTAALRRGYRVIRPEIDPEGGYGLRALYEGLLCEHFMKTGCRDSADFYASLCVRHYDELPVAQYQSLASKKLADYFEATGDERRAREWLRRYSDVTDSIVSSQGPWKKIYLDNVNTLHRYEYDMGRIRSELRRKHLVVIIILAVSLITVTLFFILRRQRQKLKAMKVQYEWERSQRQIMAMSLARDESDRVIDYVKKEAARLSQEESVSSQELLQIERNLRLHLAGKEEHNAFEEAFVSIHPDFVKRLRTMSPCLSENNIRLCSYIVIGLSNQQIAEMLNVQPSSIKQSRWRLRNKLKIPAEVSLEDFLRDLSSHG